jgi:hypothetical protein
MSLEAGWWVALTLAPDSAPLRVYVGQVQDVDERGVRLTLVDWVSGAANSWDFFAPWPCIRSVLVGPHEHATERFGDAASRWQELMSADKVEVFIDVLGEEIDNTDDEAERSKLAALRDALSNVTQSVASSLLAHYLERVTGGASAG